MIRFENVSKAYRTDNGGQKVILDNCSVIFPEGQTVGLLGRNGAGKSTMLRLISGTQDPDRGKIRRFGTVSYPIGFAGSFHPDLTGAQNARFVARIYGADTDSLTDFVGDFTELGDFFYMPVRKYSSGMKARLAFGISMGIPFDTYLIDEVTSVGDQAFRDKCARTIRERLAKVSAVMVSHSLTQIKQLCTAAMVLENGQLQYFDDVAQAIKKHRENMAAAKK